MPRERAVVFFPQGDGLSIVESLRHRFDPQASTIAAHATLVFPFASEISDSDLRAHIEQALEGQEPFRVRFEGISEADGEYVFLDAAVGADRLQHMHDRLYRGPLSAHRSTVHVYRPHITLGRIAADAARAEVLNIARRMSPVIDEMLACLHVFHDGQVGAVDRIPLGV